jgi:hypothetical protein
VLVALGHLDWWYLALGLGAFGVQALAFRADWGVGLGILGFVAAAAGALLLVIHNTGFSGGAGADQLRAAGGGDAPVGRVADAEAGAAGVTHGERGA